jgi:hypothetical protein
MLKNFERFALWGEGKGKRAEGKREKGQRATKSSARRTPPENRG